MENADKANSLSSEIHNLCFSPSVENRKQALVLLRHNFSSLTYKQQIWNYIVKLANDVDFDLSRDASSVLLSVLEQKPHVYQPWDRQKAWNDLEPIRKVSNAC